MTGTTRAEGSWLVTLWSIFGIVFMLGGGAVVAVSADQRGGHALAVVALLAFFLVPVGIAVLVRRLSGNRVRAWRVAIHTTFLFGLVTLVLAWRYRADETKAAFATAFADDASRDGGADAMASSSVAAASGSSVPPAPSATSADFVVPEAGVEPADYSFGSGTYVEADCEPLADVAALEAAHAPHGLRASAEALARARYPMGLAFLQAQSDAQLGAWYTGAPDSFSGAASRFDVAVHEGSHIWTSKRFDIATYTYSVRGDLTIVTKRLTNFHRDAIMARHLDAANDPYAKIYLSGASGAQGFNTLLDEYNAYTHSLASRYCTRDLLTPGLRMSARDGILTMMYYVETYLAIAREEHAADYAAILADPAHRTLILTIWDRAELWLRRSADVHALGISDATIKGWVYDPARLAEISRVRDAGPRDH